ncbi:Methyl-CpG-binding domain-containing protein 9 [Acorus calamus]|uniref:Methyl-CpG-binding domain-containing protein 9 n=1 Tax=Acorus calamus TaxID=4465 RepID=A0AAV9F0P3_ACOCL|nr:Methyl-CpG-binding domain-containing protein 9 [Acorus calamus]
MEEAGSGERFSVTGRDGSSFGSPNVGVDPQSGPIKVKRGRGRPPKKRHCGMPSSGEIRMELSERNGAHIMDDGFKGILDGSHSMRAVEEIQLKELQTSERGPVGNGLADPLEGTGAQLNDSNGSLQAFNGSDWKIFNKNEETQLKSNGFCENTMDSISVGVVKGNGIDVKRNESSFESPDEEENILIKRGQVSGRLQPMTLTPLRRSTRRTTPLSVYADKSSTMHVNSAHEEPGEQPKGMFVLPPPSNNLNSDDLPILDIFSVYSFLRSFSTNLFLSPFTVEAFVAALRCNFVNSLMDSIHFCILQALKQNLELLSNEGVESALACLRNLNWELLDLITWPIYLAEYLLIHCPVMIPGVNLGCLRLLSSEYYKQPATVKLSVLKCLCDDLVETEAIRSELSMRMTELEFNADNDTSANANITGKDTVNDFGSSCLNKEAVKEDGDRNFDECCLCKMDGNLICCDGCPAAYHSRCVGVAKDLLPEGDWFCPECIMKKHDGVLNPLKSLCGAKTLGVDSYGRLYLGSYSYLLVSDSCDPDSSYSYYSRDDITAVIEALKSSGMIPHHGIINAISLFWKFDNAFYGANGHHDTDRVSLNLDYGFRVATPSSFFPQTNDAEREILVEKISKPESDSTLDVHLQDCKNELTSSWSLGFKNPDMGVHNSFSSFEESSANHCSAVQKEHVGFSVSDPSLLVINQIKVRACQVQCEPGTYVNCYSSGHMVSSISKELMHILSESMKKQSEISAEEIVSSQLKAIFNKSKKFFLYRAQKLYLDVQKESCGWCFNCKAPTDETCLFKLADKKLLDFSKMRAVGFRTNNMKKSHLSSVTCHILSIENRLHGLLCGPWENPRHSDQWRKSVSKAFSVASLKPLLLTLESNLRRVALTSEWSKQVDSDFLVGSASYTTTTSVKASAEHGPSTKLGRGRKQSRRNISKGEPEFVPMSGMYWWRGGRLSRELFYWKMLPHSLASKAGRQAGCRKIPGMLYTEGSKFAKRIKYIAWKAAVEMSATIAQLAYQVSELDSSIRWHDLSNCQFSTALVKEARQVATLRKAIIRKKCVEGLQVKYLLDFGKRKFIPDIVTRHGVILEESSGERKKYWLDESFVPLKRLKAFEERKIARKFNKLGSWLPCDEGVKLVKHLRQKGFHYLFSKREKSESHQCGHCKKYVARGAVNCNLCKGFFHKRHANASKDAMSILYTCFKCSIMITPKRETRRKDIKLEKSKISMNELPKRVLRKAKHVEVKIRKKVRKSRRSMRQIKSKKRKDFSKSHSRNHFGRGKRTKMLYPYWFDGLLWTRKPNDDRRMLFKERNVCAPFTDSGNYSHRPICSLCREDYEARLIYVSCENCKDWFHGDAFGINSENVNNLMGMKCRACLKKSPLTCPYSKNSNADEFQLHEEKTDTTKLETVQNTIDDEKVLVESCNIPKILPHTEFSGLFNIEQSVHKDNDADKLREEKNDGEKMETLQNTIDDEKVLVESCDILKILPQAEFSSSFNLEQSVQEDNDTDKLHQEKNDRTKLETVLNTIDDEKVSVQSCDIPMILPHTEFSGLFNLEQSVHIDNDADELHEEKSDRRKLETVQNTIDDENVSVKSRDGLKILPHTEFSGLFNLQRSVHNDNDADKLQEEKKDRTELETVQNTIDDEKVLEESCDGLKILPHTECSGLFNLEQAEHKDNDADTNCDSYQALFLG